MLELVLPALVGALVSIPVSLLLVHWQSWVNANRRIKDAQFDLLRQISAHSAGGPGLALALNQVPVLFSNDSEVLQKFRDSTGPAGKQSDMDAVSDLILLLATKVGLSGRVARQDLERGFDGRE